MKHKTATKYGVIVSVIFLVLCISGVIFIKVKIDSKRESIVKKYEVVNVLRNESDIFALQQSLQSNKKEIDTLLSYIVKEDGVVAYVETLEKAAKLNGAELAVEKIDLEDGLGKKRVIDSNGKSKIDDVRTYGRLIIRLKVEGSWAEVMSFVSTLEQLPKNTVINEMRVSSVFGEGRVGWVVNMVVEAITT